MGSCACRSRDARQCHDLRYPRPGWDEDFGDPSQHDPDEVCECACHDEGDCDE